MSSLCYTWQLDLIQCILIISSPTSCSLAVLMEILIVSIVLGTLSAIRFAGKGNDYHNFLHSKGRNTVLHVFIMSNTTKCSYKIVSNIDQICVKTTVTNYLHKQFGSNWFTKVELYQVSQTFPSWQVCLRAQQDPWSFEDPPAEHDLVCYNLH